MKKIILLAFMAMTTMTMSAQHDEYTNEISISYGLGSVTDIFSTFAGALTASDQTNYWGTVGVEYVHFLNPSLGLGGVVTASGCKWGSKADYATTYISVMPTLKWSWLRKAHFGMYSKVAAGVMFVSNSPDGSSSKSATHFTGQVSPLCVEFGGALRGFAELGFGEQGILNLGLRYKF